MDKISNSYSGVVGQKMLKTERRTVLKGFFELLIKDLMAHKCSFYYFEIDYTSSPSEETDDEQVLKAWVRKETLEYTDNFYKSIAYVRAVRCMCSAFEDPMSEFTFVYFDPIKVKYHIFLIIKNLFTIEQGTASLYLMDEIVATATSMNMSVKVFTKEEAYTQFLTFMSNEVDENGYLYFDSFSPVYAELYFLNVSFEELEVAMQVPWDNFERGTFSSKFGYRGNKVSQRLSYLPSMPISSYNKEDFIIRLWQVYLYINCWKVHKKKIYTYRGKYVGTIKKILFGKFSQIWDAVYFPLTYQLLNVNWAEIYPLYKKAAEKKVLEDPDVLNIIEVLNCYYRPNSEAYKVILDQEDK
jgi:hypothetical protein